MSKLIYKCSERSTPFYKIINDGITYYSYTHTSLFDLFINHTLLFIFDTGWYSRVTSFTSSASIGIIFGEFPNQNLADPSNYAALLVQIDNEPLFVVDTNPIIADATVRGNDVTSNPDDNSPAVFTWSGKDVTSNFVGQYVCVGDNQVFNMTFGIYCII